MSSVYPRRRPKAAFVLHVDETQDHADDLIALPGDAPQRGIVVGECQEPLVVLLGPRRVAPVVVKRLAFGLPDRAEVLRPGRADLDSGRKRQRWDWPGQVTRHVVGVAERGVAQLTKKGHGTLLERGGVRLPYPRQAARLRRDAAAGVAFAVGKQGTPEAAPAPHRVDVAPQPSDENPLDDPCRRPLDGHNRAVDLGQDCIPVRIGVQGFSMELAMSASVGISLLLSSRAQATRRRAMGA